MTDYDKNLNVNEAADKITVTTKVKRGTGNRDQDTIKVKIKGDDPQEAVEKLNEVVSRLHNTSEDLRAMQPGESDD